MRITPLDIRNHAFARRMSGYDREEVDAFLQMVAEDFEGLVRDLSAARRDNATLKARVDDLTSHESVLKDTLTTAQQLAEDLKRTAAKEAEVLISEAEIKAEKILDAAHRRAAQLAEDIREMRMLKIRLAADVRATLEAHLGMLEGLAADPPEDPQLDGKVAYLTRSPGDLKSEGG